VVVEDTIMGRDKSSKYRKTLRDQMYSRLTGMLALGESKRQAMQDGSAKEKIFSKSTYNTYRKHIKYYLQWLQKNHPEVTTLKKAKKYVNTWLQSRVDQMDDNGNRLSAWTIQTEAAALNKVFKIDVNDPDRFCPPQRRRENIKRSRGIAVRDRHFSKTNNAELIRFCQGTGCRRNVLEKLTGDDLWSRQRMEDEKITLSAKDELTKEEQTRLYCISDALAIFPDQDTFIYHKKDKNGRYRFSPIIGRHKAEIIDRFVNTASGEKVWHYVSGNADIHGYRSDYATAIYKMYARKISEIPYDRINRGTRKRFQSEVYTCRKDEKGKKLDKAAMLKCSKALGHNRLCVVADNYIRNL
jgi:hypothetical protein